MASSADLRRLVAWLKKSVGEGYPFNRCVSVLLDNGYDPVLVRGAVERYHGVTPKVERISKEKLLRIKKVPAKKSTGKKGSAVGGVSALSGAVKDLENELVKLGKKKHEIEDAMASVSSEVAYSQAREREFQQKIAALVAEEGALKGREKNLQVRLDRVGDKMAKVAKIRAEMGDV